MPAIVNDITDPHLEFNVTTSSNTTTICPSNGFTFIQWGPSGPPPYETSNGSCQHGASAAEVLFLLDANANATKAEKDACMSTVVMGWIRAPKGSCGTFEDRNLTDANAAFVRCKPRLVTGKASIQVDAGGRLQEPAKNVEIHDLAGNLSKTFSNDPVNLLGQSNKYLFKFSTGDALWHNDSYATDAMNYFALRDGNSSRLVDPMQGPPPIEDIQRQLGKAYSRLFAIWMGTNKENLLVPRTGAVQAPVKGWTVVTEQRLFLSTPMFAISEGILFIYVFVAIMVYLRRPGRYLARMPTSIASIISLFAASAAVQDMKGTSHLDKKGRAKHLQGLDSRYGYGSYIGGGDGRVHIGIEKTPFVRVRAKSTWFDQKVKSFRKGSAV